MDLVCIETIFFAWSLIIFKACHELWQGRRYRSDHLLSLWIADVRSLHQQIFNIRRDSAQNRSFKEIRQQNHRWEASIEGRRVFIAAISVFSAIAGSNFVVVAVVLIIVVVIGRWFLLSLGSILCFLPSKLIASRNTHTLSNESMNM